MTRVSAACKALASLAFQSALLLDLALNTILLGVGAIFVALWTGDEQEPCYASETLSAHAWRSDQKHTWWARMTRPAIDFLFSWQKPNPALGAGHCERAFTEQKLRMYLPREYQ